MASNGTPKKITDLTFDPDNANRGTERGSYMLERSLEKFGAARSIVIDKNGVVIAGNKTLAKAGELGIEDAAVIQTNGEKVVAVQRMDLDPHYCDVAIQRWETFTGEKAEKL